MQTFVHQFPVKNGLKRDALSSLLFNFALQYSISKVKGNHKLLKFNNTHQVIVCANLWGQSIHTTCFIGPL